MDKRDNALLPSLVGSHIEYRQKGEVLVTDVTSTRNSIAKDIELAGEVKSLSSIMLLGEMVAYHKKQSYYVAVRSSIVLGRVRTVVVDYLEGEISDRLKRILKELKPTYGRATNPVERKVKVKALQYIIKGNPKLFTDEVKAVLTKDEQIACAR